MKCCTFFGHHDCPDAIKPLLQKEINTLIREGVTVFYVGNHGRFDDLALACLREMQKDCPTIRYAVVLPYYPSGRETYRFSETIYPEGVEKIPKRFAINYCNRWMIERADVAIVYVTRSWGGAAKFAKYAEGKEKKVVRLKE